MRCFARLLSVFVVLGLIAPWTSAAPSGLLERAPGPSGVVVTPAGGTTYTTRNLWPTLKLRFQYQTVNALQSPCSTFWCRAETWRVDVVLRDDTNGNEVALAKYLTPQASGQNIDAWLTAPQATCGTFRLVVREYQNYYGSFIDFQSAAPLITINCVGLI